MMRYRRESFQDSNKSSMLYSLPFSVTKILGKKLGIIQSHITGNHNNPLPILDSPPSKALDIRGHNN